MPKVDCVGHVGIHTANLEEMTAFYADIIGLEITDDDVEHGLVFLSADPAVEHHHLVLAKVDEAPARGSTLQQVSFRCSSLEDVLGYFERFKTSGTEIQYAVTHGNAIGVYFFDPDGNRCEVYWQTGHAARQAFRVGLDFTQPIDDLLDQVRSLVKQYGESGVIADEVGTLTAGR